MAAIGEPGRYFSVPLIYISALHYLYIALTAHFYSLYFALSISYLHSALLFSAMGLCILPSISPRVGGGRASHDPIFTGVRGPAPAETSRVSPLPATVFQHGALVGGTSELSVLSDFIFDLSCTF